MLPKLEQRLLDITMYHSREWAKRLEEIGGPGVGGTELAYRPKVIQQAETENEMVLLALQSSISQTWEEAAWCYAYGWFRASILLSAMTLELILKFELFRRGYPVSSKTLGRLIFLAKEKGVITDAVASLARSITTRRNDITHANIQTDRPESLFRHLGEEHEVEPIQDISRNVTKDGWLTGDGETISVSPTGKQPTYYLIHLFLRAARASLFELKEVLKFFYTIE